MVCHPLEWWENKILQQADSGVVLRQNRKLSANWVEVLSYLLAVLSFSQDCVCFLNSFKISDDGMMSIPGVDVLCQKFVVDTFKYPVLQEVLPHIDQAILVACFDNHWFEGVIGIWLLYFRFFSLISSHSTTLDRCLGSVVVETQVPDRCPLFVFWAVFVEISAQVIQKDVEARDKVVKKLDINGFFNFWNWPSSFVSVYNRYVLRLSCAVVGQLSHSWATSKEWLVWKLALLEEQCELSTFFHPRQDSCRDVNDDKVEMVEPSSRHLIVEHVFRGGLAHTPYLRFFFKPILYISFLKADACAFFLLKNIVFLWFFEGYETQVGVWLKQKFAEISVVPLVDVHSIWGYYELFFNNILDRLHEEGLAAAFAVYHKNSHFFILYNNWF